MARKVCKAPGQALSDFNIFRLIAHHWGCGELFREWSSPEAVFQIMARLSKGRPADFTGISGYDFLDAHGGVQWPAPAKPESKVRGKVKVGEEKTSEAASDVSRVLQVAAPLTFESERRLFEDGQFYHPDGRARFMFDPPQPMPEPPDANYPFILLTGRGTSSQWHTQTRTDKSDVLRKLYPKDPYVEINPDDANRLSIAPEDMVSVASRRGEVRVRAVVLASLQPGQIFMPMHYPETNLLTHDSFDPHSKEPSYKACAVAIRSQASP